MPPKEDKTPAVTHNSKLKVSRHIIWFVYFISLNEALRYYEAFISVPSCTVKMDLIFTLFMDGVSMLKPQEQL